MAHVCNLSAGEVRKDGCWRFETNLGYTVSSMSALTYFLTSKVTTFIFLCVHTCGDERTWEVFWERTFGTTGVKCLYHRTLHQS